MEKNDENIRNANPLAVRLITLAVFVSNLVNSVMTILSAQVEFFVKCNETRAQYFCSLVGSHFQRNWPDQYLSRNCTIPLL